MALEPEQGVLDLQDQLLTLIGFAVLRVLDIGGEALDNEGEVNNGLDQVVESFPHC